MALRFARHYHVDRLPLRKAEHQATGIRLIIRVLGDYFTTSDGIQYGVLVQPALEHASQGMAAE